MMKKYIAILGLFLLTACSEQTVETLCESSTDKDVCIETHAVDNLSPKTCELLNDNLREVCDVQVIASAMQKEVLTREFCHDFKNSNSMSDCLAYVVDETNRVDYCLDIKEHAQRQLCMGTLKRFSSRSDTVTVPEMCTNLRIGGEVLWADICRMFYVQNSLSSDIDACKVIEGPLQYYNCVKQVGLVNEDAGLCSHIEERLPFPANFPTDVFSPSGCAFWVNNKGSFEGFYDKDKFKALSKIN